MARAAPARTRRCARQRRRCDRLRGARRVRQTERAQAVTAGARRFAGRARKPRAGVGDSPACFGYPTPHRASPPRFVPARSHAARGSRVSAHATVRLASVTRRASCISHLCVPSPQPTSTAQIPDIE
ncbi:hypothetical protein C6Q12_26465 [Burkholderia multivorans]|nr:hypothetical protein C6Q12_26465 [Burkholderia multivorans]